VHWRFTTGTPEANWFAPQFVDDAWREGEAGFGSRNPPGGLVATSWSTPDIWLRRIFVITNLDLAPGIALWMNHDDAAEVYLNGVLACTAPNYTTAYHEFNITEESRKALKRGTNIIAVHANQTVNAQYIDVGVMVREKQVAPAVDTVRATDWPQFLGFTRDGVYHGPALRETWPAEGPRILWRMEVGEGYSSPVVGEGRLIVSHRLRNEWVVDCVNPKTGQKHWSFHEPMTFEDAAHHDNGPRATPSISRGRVFLCNSDGQLISLNLADGKKIWARRLDKAAEVAASLIKRDAQNPIYHTLLGEVRAAQQDYPAAEGAFRAALAIKPDLTAATRDLAQVYSATGRTDEARNLYNDLLAKNPNEANALLGLADTYIAQQKWTEAIDAINRARAATRNDSAPGLKLVGVYQRRQDWISAKTVAAELAAQFPGDANILDAHGQAQLAAGETNGAISSFKRAYELAPNSVPILSRYLASLGGAGSAVLATDGETDWSKIATWRPRRGLSSKQNKTETILLPWVPGSCCNALGACRPLHWGGRQPLQSEAMQETLERRRFSPFA